MRKYILVFLRKKERSIFILFLLLAPPCLSIFYVQDSGPGMCQTTQPLILFCLNWGAVKVWGRRKGVCPGTLLRQLCAQWVGRGSAGHRFDSCLGGLRLEHTQWNWKGGDAETWKTFRGQNQLIWATGRVQRVTKREESVWPWLSGLDVALRKSSSDFGVLFSSLGNLIN